jgi:HAD superfamily hydrolase (TIGR01509 family)
LREPLWFGAQRLLTGINWATGAADMSQPFLAVIFDLDGVLADSEPWWTRIDAELLAKYAVTYQGEYHENVLGVSYRLAVEFYKNAYHLSAPVEELIQRRGQIATGFFANRIELFPYARRTLEELQQMKIRLAVATSSVSASARPFLERTGIKDFFEVIITGDEIERGKPHPDIYLRTSEKLNLPAAACLVVEDALAGVAAGKAANMRVAAIPDIRFTDRQRYEKQADYVLNSLSEIPALVRAANATH